MRDELTRRPPGAKGKLAPNGAAERDAVLPRGQVEAGLPDDRAGTVGPHTDSGLAATTIAAWRSACSAAPKDISLRLGLIRSLEATGEPEAVDFEMVRVLTDASPFEELGVADQNRLIKLLRGLAIGLAKSGFPNLSEKYGAIIAERNGPVVLALWAQGLFALARYELAAALTFFDQALCAGAPPPGSVLNLHAEKALAFASYHLFGEAREAAKRACDNTIAGNEYYRRRLEVVRATQSLCGDGRESSRYPECLVDLVLEEIAIRPPCFVAQPGHVTMISASLGMGGGEQQTVTIARRIAGDKRIKGLTLLVRSTHLRRGDDFFLPAVQELPLNLFVYGKAWETRSDVPRSLPELSGHPRIVAAIELMPVAMREDIVRICRLLWDLRPRAVHIWQDIPTAALACAIIGVPSFFIHRGSLSPERRMQNERQKHTHSRPMRHIYRRMLERPGFAILNNSAVGSAEDRAWTAWPNPAPFRVVHNAIDFGSLGSDMSRNFALRRKLGIPDHAPVIGSAFRFDSVKRPLLWARTARRICDLCPAAHFLIIGSGEIWEDVKVEARQLGISERLHLPGRVSNVGTWYRAMDLFLLTSEREGIPNSIIEAQYFGLPIVATNVGGLAEGMEHGRTGFLVPGNAEDYAQKVAEVLTDTVWLEAARAHAHVFALAQFDIRHIVNELVGRYFWRPSPGVPDSGRAQAKLGGSP